MTSTTVNDTISSTMPNFGEHSHLDRHNFNTEVNKTSIVVSFHTYYSEKTPVYYELLPFVQMLKFVKDRDIINSIPRGWIKRCEDFHDEKLVKAQILPETLFGEFSAVHFIITSSDSKIRLEFIEKLSELCFRKIDSTRMQRIHHKNRLLSEEVVLLRSRQEKHSSVLDVIRETLKIISEHHIELEKVIKKIYDKI
ncbi:ACH96143.1 unknown protein [Kallithea virus]|uniref:Uncharacterized protein n=1 Tax=Kallithea virus TaxID=1654582 RepID=A0A1S5VFZ9_9VIRU|nr:ACH96143.1 unknown protein [Kallithea virus]AQN78566.1 ACH96143.1 unknown protein [Kallithea virus]